MRINVIKIFWGILLISFTEVLLAEFSSSKDSTSVGSSVTLTWTSNASSCFGEDDWTGTKAGSGSESLGIAKTGWNLYTLNFGMSSEYLLYLGQLIIKKIL
ncbi:MAG: hypothetical protein P8J93_07365 [SAR86 cluster bacterium]|nr:hypothetical protein [SAR86 cluster bacterium]